MTELSLKEKVDIEKSCSMIRRNPKEEQTKELILNAIKGGIKIRYVNKELIDDEIADAFVLKDWRYFKELPRNKKTYERCVLAVKNCLPTKDIPIKFRTQEMFDIMIKENRYRINEVPNEFIRREMLLNAIEGGLPILFCMPKKEILDVEFVKQLVTKGATLRNEWIKDFQTKEIVEIAVRNEAREIEEVKPELITEELCYLAVLGGCTLHVDVIQKHQSERIINHLIEKKYFVRPDGLSVYDDNHCIKRVKEELCTKEFFKKVLEQDNLALKYAPKEIIDEELCYEAICKGAPIQVVSVRGQQSQRIANKSFENDKSSYQIIEDRFKTKEMSLEAFEHNLHFIAYTPEEFQTKEMWERCFRESDNPQDIVKFLPDKFYTDELFSILIKRNWQFINVIPFKCRTSNLWMIAYEQDERALEYFGM